MKWWLTRGTKTEGPFAAEHVAEWLKTGQIQPDTMACPEGSQEWKRLSEVDEFSKLVPPPSTQTGAPPPPPLSGPPPASPEAVIGPANHRRANFGVLTAAIVLGGGVVLWDAVSVNDVGDDFTPLVGLMLCVFAASLLTWALYHYHLWRLLPASFAETTPGKAVGYLFIPFFNCYWVFRSYLGVNRGLNRLADAHNLPQPRANVGLATAAAVFFVVGWVFILLYVGLTGVDDIENRFIIRDQTDLENAYNQVVTEHVGLNVASLLFSSIPGFVVWLLMVLNQKGMVEHLLANDVPVNPASGLLARHA